MRLVLLFTCAGCTDQLPDHPFVTRYGYFHDAVTGTAPFLSSYGDLAGCSFSLQVTGGRPANAQRPCMSLACRCVQLFTISWGLLPVSCLRCTAWPCVLRPRHFLWCAHFFSLVDASPFALAVSHPPSPKTKNLLLVSSITVLWSEGSKGCTLIDWHDTLGFSGASWSLGARLEPGRANKVNEARLNRWSVGFANLVLGHVGTKGCLMYHFRGACSAFGCRRMTSCGSVCERWDFEGLALAMQLLHLFVARPVVMPNGCCTVTM